MGKHELPVLKGLSLDIFKNEYVALMGPSGSGKSTLMNIIGCLDTPTAGRYILNNNDVSQMADDSLATVRNKEIGFVFQQFNLLPRLTAAENVALPLVYAGMKKKERLEKAMQMLELVKLTDRSHHRPNELSGGQCQRIALNKKEKISEKGRKNLADAKTGFKNPQWKGYVITPDGIFASLGVAAEFYDLTPVAISRRCSNPKFVGWSIRKDLNDKHH